MSIQELLSKVKEQGHKVLEQDTLTTEQDSIEASVDEKVNLEELSFHNLLEYYSEVCSWLETHEFQSGTENKLDVNDRPYDPKMYCEKLEEMQNIYSEIFQRPLTDGLDEQVRKFGL